MRTRLGLGLALLCLAAACSDSGPSDGDVTEDQLVDPGDSTTWKWHTRSGDSACGLSDVGTAVKDAVLASGHNLDIFPEGAREQLIVTKRNAAGPALVDGGQMFPALRELIAHAKYEVDAEWHRIDAGSDGFLDLVLGVKQLHERLKAENPQKPVVVRIINPKWALKFGGGDIEALANVFRTQIPDLDPNLIKLEIASHRYFGLAVMHVKIAIVDGVYVHVGGGNLTMVQNYRNGHIPEHDSAYLLKGEVGLSALAQFDELWNQGGTTPYDCNGAKCEKIDDRPKLSVLQEGGHAAEVIRPNLAAAGVPADACLPMIFMAKKATENIFNAGDNNPVGNGLYAAFKASRDTLKISTPNLNDKSAVEVLNVVKSGRTKVRTIISIKYNEILELAPYIGGGNNRTSVMLISNLAPAEATGDNAAFDPRWFSRDGKTIYQGGGEGGGRHLKYYSVDGKLALVGSTNLDKQSLHRSREVTVAVDDPTVTKLWDSIAYDRDYAKAIRAYHFDRTNEDPPTDTIPEEKLDDTLTPSDEATLKDPSAADALGEYLDDLP